MVVGSGRLIVAPNIPAKINLRHFHFDQLFKFYIAQTIKCETNNTMMFYIITFKIIFSLTF